MSIICALEQHFPIFFAVCHLRFDRVLRPSWGERLQAFCEQVFHWGPWRLFVNQVGAKSVLHWYASESESYQWECWAKKETLPEGHVLRCSHPWKLPFCQEAHRLCILSSIFIVSLYRWNDLFQEDKASLWLNIHLDCLHLVSQKARKWSALTVYSQVFPKRIWGWLNMQLQNIPSDWEAQELFATTVNKVFQIIMWLQSLS